MSNARLQEISRLPLDQRAARIAELFAEGTGEQPPRATQKQSRRFGSLLRALSFWAHPRRAPLAVAAFAAFIGGKPQRAFHGRRVFGEADGFFGVAPVPDADSALDLYAHGFYFGAFPGLASLWSPPRRAIVRPAEAIRLPTDPDADSCVANACVADIRLDSDFERLLDLCDIESPGFGRRPAFRAPLAELFAHGLAHGLELRDEAGETQAVIVGVAVGGVFTVEGFFARDRAVFGRAVSALARHLAGLNFSALDFRTLSPQVHGLPIELIGREKFQALLASPGARAGRWGRDATARAGRRAA